MIKEAIIVEGKYDKNTLSQVVDAVIITTDGFGIFNDTEKRDMIVRIAKARGIIVLTDSDGAGFMIRNKIKGLVPTECVKHAYIPDVYGKERRKREASREGTLGVEGMPPEVLKKAIEDAGATACGGERITKSDMYELGLCGGADSNARREKLLKALNLPRHLSANALLTVLNALYGREEFIKIAAHIE